MCSQPSVSEGVQGGIGKEKGEVIKTDSDQSMENPCGKKDVGFFLIVKHPQPTDSKE